MAQCVLTENAGVESVRYVLPNKHYIPVDMRYIGVDNTTPCVLPTLLSAARSSGTREFAGLRGPFLFWKRHRLVLWGGRLLERTKGGWFFDSLDQCLPRRLVPLST